MAATNRPKGGSGVNIVFIVYKTGKGGAERVTVTLAEYLSPGATRWGFSATNLTAPTLFIRE